LKGADNTGAQCKLKSLFSATLPATIYAHMIELVERAFKVGMCTVLSKSLSNNNRINKNINYNNYSLGLS